MGILCALTVFKTHQDLLELLIFKINPFMIMIPLLAILIPVFFIRALIKSRVYKYPDTKPSDSESFYKLLGLFLATGSAATTAYFTYEHASTDTYDQEERWAFDFFFILAQDILIYPILGVITQGAMYFDVKTDDYMAKNYGGFVQRNLLTVPQMALFGKKLPVVNSKNFIEEENRSYKLGNKKVYPANTNGAQNGGGIFGNSATSFSKKSSVKSKK
mmetsp:Transcript_20040/g.17125  ORF Transcript_20040/g.17125 Transcript_20040/m.17125 type:complete len:217 (+) Transcript_20040:1157-1807(+)|eukprot:CAMPEP_0114600736 /NCGR_PEP_ID=MMETSP0125-20121206/23342_1 /TAXON_ID=485358 ORGANISM="Aristerostoma sp., Strain ATCC 50986" /NCGR_SAMPLE_ID=MMETSP0125 /ASSEMBLY_ACC=CAM_ASM_000245 /LENGTH=216 /DNA_ID=CAMNT_0001809237 /DNA_START=1152 /DNA_END=1802 /DNA_ORIENTATION=+